MLWTDYLDWKRYLKQIQSYDNSYSNQIFVKYEDIISEMGNCIRAISTFLDINLDGIRPENGELMTILPGEVRSIHMLISQPPQPQRIDDWKSGLPENIIYLIEKTCMPILYHCGYVRSTSGRKLFLEMIRILQITRFLAREYLLKLRLHLRY